MLHHTNLVIQEVFMVNKKVWAFMIASMKILCIGAIKGLIVKQDQCFTTHELMNVTRYQKHNWNKKNKEFEIKDVCKVRNDNCILD
jgi:hypothetical protein